MSELALKVAQAEETGNLTDVTATLWRGVDIGALNKDDVELKIMQVKEKAAIRAHDKVQDAMATDAGNDPEAFLKNIKTPDIMMKVYEGSVPDDFGWIQGLAGNALAYKKRQVSDWKVSLRHDTIVKAVDGMSVVDFQHQLTQTQGLDAEDKVELMALFKSRSETMNVTGSDPLRSTQDYPALHNVYMMFRNGEITSQEQLHELWTADGQIHWSLAQQESLRKRLDPKAEDSQRFWSDPVVKSVLADYDSWFMDDDGKIKDKEKWYEWGNGRGALERELQAIQADPGPNRAQRMDEQYQIATKAQREEEVDGILRRLGRGLAESRDLQLYPQYYAPAYGATSKELTQSVKNQPGKVQMRGPDGLIREFDAEYAEQAKKNGYKDL